MPDLTEQEELTKKAYDNHGAEWDKGTIDHGYWVTQREMFKELLPSGKVIDIGAGAGREAIPLMGMGYDYVGTDISEGILEVARRKVPQAEFIHQSVYDLDFPEKFDGFWAQAVLLHVPKARIDEALERIKSVLKPNAVGFIAIKDGEGERVEKNEVGGAILERFFSYWSEDEFRRVLSKNDFEVVKYTFIPVGEQTRWHCFIVRLANEK